MPVDTRTLAVTFGLNASVAAACLAAFTALRAARFTRRFYAPKRYSPLVPPSQRPPPLRWWLWMLPLLRVRERELLAVAGYDGLMYLRALRMGLKLFLYLSVWGLAVVIPANVSGGEVRRLMLGQSPGTSQEQAGDVPIGPGNAEEVQKAISTNKYVFSDLDRLSMANIAPGSSLMWVHLVSVYVVTLMTLRVLWLHSQNAVVLRLAFLTRAPRGGPSHTALIQDIPGQEYGTVLEAVRHWLSTATLVRFLPRRARLRIERWAARISGAAAGGFMAAGQLADSFADLLTVPLLSEAATRSPSPSDSGEEVAKRQKQQQQPEPAPAATAATFATAPIDTQCGSGTAGGGSSHGREVVDRAGVLPPADTGPAPGQQQPAALLQAGSSGLSEATSGAADVAVFAAALPAPAAGPLAGGAAAAHPQPTAAAATTPGAAAAPAPALLGPTMGGVAAGGGLGRHQQQGPLLASGPLAGAASGLPLRLHPPAAKTAPGAASGEGGGGKPHIGRLRRRRQPHQHETGVAGHAPPGRHAGGPQGAGGAGGSGSGSRSSTPKGAWTRAEEAMAVHGVDFPTYVASELRAALPPCQLVALAVVRDERRLGGAVSGYARSRTSLEDLMDKYAADLAAGRRVKRAKMRVVGPLLGQWAADLYGLRPSRVDALQHLRTALQAYYQQLCDALGEEGGDQGQGAQARGPGARPGGGEGLPYAPTAFATFARRWDLAVASTTLLERDEGVWRVSVAPGPGEVLWGNLRMRMWERGARLAAMRVAYAVLVLTYVVPVSALQGLLQVRRLEQLPVLKELLSIPVVRSLVAGLLPGAVLRLFVLLLPYLMAALVRWAGATSVHEVDFRASTLTFIFQVATVFLSSFIAGALLNQVQQFIDNPSSVVRILGAGAPQTASFFMTYILFNALTMKSLGLLRLAGLLLYCTRAGLAATPRARARLWQVQVETFANTLPFHTIILLLGLVFSLVAPLILPICVLYFAVALLLERYQLLYVWSRQYESGGTMWSQVLNQVMTGLYFFHAVMLGLLSIKQFRFTPLMLFAPIGALAFHLNITRMYRRPWRTLALRDAVDIDSREAPAGCASGEATPSPSQPPALQLHPSSPAPSPSPSPLSGLAPSLYMSPAEAIVRERVAHEALMEEAADMERRLRQAAVLDPRTAAAHWRADHAPLPGDEGDVSSAEEQEEEDQEDEGTGGSSGSGAEEEAAGSANTTGARGAAGSGAVPGAVSPAAAAVPALSQAHQALAGEENLVAAAAAPRAAVAHGSVGVQLGPGGQGSRGPGPGATPTA